jgi:DNA-binding CsgD family transcriptional regulator
MATTASSSNAKGVGEPVKRIDLARAVAEDIITALPPGSDALILEAGRDARVVSPLDRDRVRVKAAIERVSVKDVEGDLGAAVALAVDRLRQLGGSRRVIVITDGNLARPSSLTGAALPLEVLTVGEPAENAAIVRVDVRSGTDPTLGREQVQAFLLVASFGKSPREIYVTMRQENASDVLASRRVLVQPGERLPVALESLVDGRLGALSPAARDALAGVAPVAARPPAGLTEREVAVLALMADGLSNRDIGARLHISQHTAANHVRSILMKTQSANRTEAAAWALRRGLSADVSARRR